MQAADDEECNGKVVCVVEELVVLAAEVDCNDDHACQTEPAKLSKGNGEVVVVNLYIIRNKLTKLKECRYPCRSDL